MSKQRLSLVIFSLLGIISCFLPWISNIIDKLGVEVLTGQICVGLFAVVLIVSLIGDIKKDLKEWQVFVPYTAGILSLVTSVLHILLLSAITPTITGEDGLTVSNSNLGFTVYIAAFASLLICVFIFVMRDAKKELENVKIIRKVVKEVAPDQKKVKKTSSADEYLSPADRKKKLLTKREDTPVPTKAPTKVPVDNAPKPTEKPAQKKDVTSSDHDRFMPK
jgi:hypothetical protein